MGYGDEIMVTGQAKAMQEIDTRPVCVLGVKNQIRRSDIWRNNPRIVYDMRGAQILKNGPSCRPYVDYEKTTKEKWAYTNWKVTPGEFYFNSHEESLSNRIEGMVLIEPNIKSAASPNKLWGFDHCQELVNSNRNISWVQIGPSHNKWLKNVRIQVTENFRVAVATMAKVNAFVSPEGGIHHAAAALGIRGVVIFGEMTSPLNTGYDIHTNLVAGNNPCGWRIPCLSCMRAMDSITPELVMEKLENYL